MAVARDKNDSMLSIGDMVTLLSFSDELIKALPSSGPRQAVMAAIGKQVEVLAIKEEASSAKIFKWRTTTLAANKSLKSTKKHPMKKITTRVYYPGLHSVEVVVNGLSVAKGDFHLLMP